MHGRNRRKELAQNVVERRRREDEAPRLSAEVPSLARLSLAIDERGEAGFALAPGHVRRVIVERAAALFELSCAAGGCDGGAHDATSAIMRELRRGSQRFEGEVSCDRCKCVVRYVASAEYTPEPADSRDLTGQPSAGTQPSRVLADQPAAGTLRVPGSGRLHNL
jgi:hypothetical protein